MKKILLLAVIVLFVFTTLVAAKPIITADEQYFDTNSGLYVLKGNVTIQVGNRTITAGTAKIDMTSLEVWGYNGITVTQDDIYFTGDSVYVYGADKHATISGGVNFSKSGIAIRANSVDFNWKTKLAVFTGNVNVTQDNATYGSDEVTYNIVTNTIL